MGSPEGGGEGGHPTKCTEGSYLQTRLRGCTHTHTHKDPQDSNKSEPVASSHSPNRRVRHSPGGPFPALPRRARGAGGKSREIAPFAPFHTGEASEAPGLCRGTRRCRGRGAPPESEAVPAAGVAPPAAARGGGLGLGVHHFPVPSPAPRGHGSHGPSPGLRGPRRLSPVEPRRCRAAAITRAETRPPSRHPPPQRGNAAAAGGV